MEQLLLLCRGVVHAGAVDACGQQIDLLYGAGELAVLLAADRTRHKDAQVADAVMRAEDDGLVMGTHVVVAGVKVGDPAQGLGRRCDVVAIGTEHQDGERILRRSMRTPSEVSSRAVESLLPMNRLSTMYCISTSLRKT